MKLEDKLCKFCNGSITYETHSVNCPVTNNIERLKQEILTCTPQVLQQYFDGVITALEASNWISNKLLNYVLTTGQK